jgi:Sulfotransferase family
LASATGAGPIFVVGSPRSGTTLMRQILDRHPSIAICGETYFLPLVYTRRNAFGDLSQVAKRQRLIEEYIVNRHLKKAKLDTPELAERLSREAISYQAMFTSILKYNAERRGKRRFGEKTPQHALHLETLWDWFPDAVVLHMIRDPRASVASLQQQPFAPSSVVLNARRWLDLNLVARSFRDRPGYLEVRYEALVTNPVEELRKTCTFLDEEYSPSMLVPEETQISRRNRSRTAITQARLDVWREDLTAAEIAQIEWVVGPHLEAFGYARECPPASALTVLQGLAYVPFASARFLTARLPAVWYRFAAPAKLRQYDYWTNPARIGPARPQKGA